MFHLLLDNRGVIYGISAICSLIFALIIFSLLRNARIEPARRWATPFADTFLVLGILYVFRLAIYYYYSQQHEAPATSAVNVFTYFCSGLTNYLFLLSAYRLAEPSIERPWLRRIDSWFVGRPYVSSPLLWILCLAALLGLVGKMAENIDHIFSAVALLMMGLALYRYRAASDRVMAWIAMISSSAYALLYITNFLFNIFVLPFFPADSNTIELVFVSLLILISLVLKFGFFFSAHSLMLWLSGPLHGLDRLFESANREEKEYLESEGLVRSVREWLATETVRLYVKVPGAKDDQIAVFHYPPSKTEEGQQPRIESYCQGTSYDKVMESAATYREERGNNSHGAKKKLLIAEPILFHNSVTACLEAEVNGAGRKKDARINIERTANLKTTANLISPAVQTYREMSALNKLSQQLAEQQIAVVTYELDKDLKKIAKTVYDIASPSFIALSLDIGFHEYCATYPDALITKEWFAEFQASGDYDEAALNGNRRYRLLRTDLEIPESQRPGDEIFGRLLLGIEKGVTKTRHPTIGTNPTCRRALSDLVSDTLLDFVRGQLNQLTDRVGERLSRLESTAITDWHMQIESTAKDAKLLWTVVRCSSREEGLVGEEKYIELVKRVESPTQSERWQKKDNPINPEGTVVTDMWLQVLEQPEHGTHSVIRIPLTGSNSTLWLGVGRKGFGPELEYFSPWKYFLHNFCKIADAALVRSLIIEERYKLIAELQHIVTQTMITGIVGHQLENLARELHSTTALLDGLIADRQRAQKLLSDLETTRKTSEELHQFLKDFPQDKNPISCVTEAVQRAFRLVRKSLAEHKIKLNDFEIPPASKVKVPFHVLSNTIAIVFNNAKEAIKDARINEGRIDITFTFNEDQTMLNCDIEDDGPGVPDEIRESLFKAPVRSSKKGGHGVGLYFSAHVLRFYGADIMLLPKETHPKTTFRIQVPRLTN